MKCTPMTMKSFIRLLSSRWLRSVRSLRLYDAMKPIVGVACFRRLPQRRVTARILLEAGAPVGAPDAVSHTPVLSLPGTASAALGRLYHFLFMTDETRNSLVHRHL